uniref:Zinc finger LSD1-type domain-containing protein n=1 Tax=Aegilops tauschii TaxID=37682 RepID=M8BBF6_AEGTA
MQSQIVCHGCRSVLLYPRGAPSVCCAVCHAVTNAPPPGMEMAQLICVGCRTLLMYTRNATTVRCSCCDTVNLARPAPPGVARLTETSYGLKLADFLMNTVRPLPPTMHAPNGISYSVPSTSAPSTQSQNVTVVVENPMTVDDKGKLVSRLCALLPSANRSARVFALPSEPIPRCSHYPLTFSQVSNVVVGVTSGGKK